MLTKVYKLVTAVTVFHTVAGMATFTRIHV